jgi:predicted NUDIX family NTP pyrophosphohydrolase
MPQISAGLLMYRRRSGQVQVLLVHPGGPFWKNKDAGAWTIPKGAPIGQENLLDTARREFEEEMGSKPGGTFIPLGTLKQPSGKVIHAWASEADFDVTTVKSNLFSMEWPPRSGKMAEFPEVDRADWFSIDEARLKILKGQQPFLDRLLALL